jgi:putative endonuclease
LGRVKGDHSMNGYSLGRRGETLACSYLEKKGLKLKKRNYKVRHGEIDLIMTDGDTLVFVEVKSRSSRFYGEPIESVTWWKRKHIRYAAKLFSKACRWEERPIRFDVVEVLISPGWKPRIRHIQNAF